MDARAIRLTWSVILGNAHVRCNRGNEGKGDRVIQREGGKTSKQANMTPQLAELGTDRGPEGVEAIRALGSR